MTESEVLIVQFCCIDVQRDTVTVEHYFQQQTVVKWALHCKAHLDDREDMTLEKKYDSRLSLNHMYVQVAKLENSQTVRQESTSVVEKPNKEWAAPNTTPLPVVKITNYGMCLVCVT